MTRVRIRVRIRTSVTSCRVQVRVRYRRIILDRIKQLLCMLRLKPLDAVGKGHYLPLSLVPQDSVTVVFVATLRVLNGTCFVIDFLARLGSERAGKDA